MKYKRELLNKAKEIINDLDIETLERLDLTVNDKYDNTLDIDINIELKRELTDELGNRKI